MYRPAASTKPNRYPDHATRLRRPLTPQEVIIWNHVRANRLAGFKFRRQHPLGPYIADFYCHAARLVVEIDGDGHAHPDQAAHDRRRDNWMHNQGLEVLRLSASYVTKHTDAALRSILTLASSRARAPTGDDAP